MTRGSSRVNWRGKTARGTSRVIQRKKRTIRGTSQPTRENAYYWTISGQNKRNS